MASAVDTASSADGGQTPSIRRGAGGWAERKVEAVERRWPWALAALMLADAALLLYMGRGLTFYYDDWNFVTQDYGGGIHSLLAPHVGNISVFPIAVYKVLFHLVGLNHYEVFRLVLIALHLVSAGLIFVLASRRIPRVPALLAMVLILFLGAAWEDLLWAFQIGYMLSIAGGLAAWVLLEREDRLGDLGAMLCLVIAAGSSSLGIPVMVGVAVELSWQRQWRRGWIVAIPVVLYLLWYAGYGESQVTRESLIHAPGFVEDLAAAAFGGLIGRSLEWGRPLALLGVLVVLRRLVRPLPITPRLAGLLATALVLWIVTAAARSTISAPETSRYIYFGAVLIVLIAVELLRETTITLRAVSVAVPSVAFFAVTGLTIMHAGAVGLRETSKTVRAELGALELAAAYAPPGYQPDAQRAPQITAGPYLHTVRAIGSSPADTLAEIVASEPVSRTAADSLLLTLEPPRLRPLRTARPLSVGPAPEVVGLTAGQQAQSGSCVRFRPVGAKASLGLRVRPGTQLLLQVARGPTVKVALYRFAEALAAHVIGTLAGSNSTMLSFPKDSAVTRPWYVSLSAAQSMEVCTR